MGKKNYKMDVLVELRRIYDIQAKRIEIDHEVEKRIGKSLPTVTQDVRTAREILDLIHKLQGVDPDPEIL
jgi:hypothetical protein